MCIHLLLLLIESNNKKPFFGGKKKQMQRRGRIDRKKQISHSLEDLFLSSSKLIIQFLTRLYKILCYQEH